jgi:outer membrane protein assembly factor BamB
MTVDGNAVYAIFATGDIIAFDMEGQRLWARNLGVPDNHYGHSSSLLVWDKKLFIQYDTNKSGRMLALNPSDGKTIWDIRRNNKISWASPVLIRHGEAYQIVTTADPYVAAHDPATGKQLWSVECMMGEVGPSVAYADGIIFAANEYAKLVAIESSGNNAKTIWENDEYLPEAASPVAYQGLLYLATSYGVVACYDGKTGEKYWEHEAGQGFYASPMVADGKVYVIDMGGKMHIFRSGKEKNIIGEPELGEKAFATPAFTDNRIYLRGQKNLYCIGTK